jgi:branched-chain amino acid transport system permease protein
MSVTIFKNAFGGEEGMVLEQIIILGAITSFVYALMALGFTLIYGVSGIINLAHGAFFVLGAYIFGALSNFFSSFFPAEFLYVVPVLALIVTPILTGIIGSIFYRLTLHQVLGDQIATMVVSLCGCIIFQQIIWLVFGSTLAFRFSIPAILPGNFTVSNVVIVNAQALAAVISILLFASLWIFIAKTKSGKAMKALSQDLEAAMLVGVSVEKMYMLTSAISAGIASIAAVFYVSMTGAASFYMWLQALALSFSIVILGGLGSIKGTLIGALIFGYATTIFSLTLTGAGGLVTSLPFIVMIIVLIIRPKGLFGKRIEME